MNWNLIGYLAWLLLIIWFIFIVKNIRNRHLKMIVVEKKKFSLSGTLLDTLEILILLMAFFGLTYFSIFQPVSINNSKQIDISYDYEPLVIKTAGDQGYYLVAKNDSKQIVTDYTYWVQSAKYRVSSENTTVLDSSKYLKKVIANYPWNEKKLKELDYKYQSAFVATLHAKYKNTFINGLGIRANKEALQYRIIRVPDTNFIIEE